MPNKVLTIFEADASQYFQVADKVKANAQSFANQQLFPPPVSPTNGAQAPLIQQVQAVTASLNGEAQKQMASEKAKTRVILEETAKRDAARRAEAQQIANIPITSNRPLVSGGSTVNKTPAQILFESGDPAARVNAGALSLERLAQLNRNALQEENKIRLEGLTAQKTGFQQYFESVKVLRSEDVAATIAANRIETESTVAAAEKQAVARRSSFFGRDALSVPLGGGVTSRLGVLGPAAIGIGASLAVIKFGVDAAEAFQKANDRDLELRASIEGTGADFRKVGQDARDFAERHNQDITQVNNRYSEFLKLSASTGQSIEQIGQAATDLASKRHLPDDQLVQGLKNISNGIADEKLLGASASTVFLEYARTHHVAGAELDEFGRKQAAVNELLRQGAQAAGDAQAQMTGITRLTTQVGNLADRANVGTGTAIDYFISHPSAIFKSVGNPLFALQPSSPQVDTSQTAAAAAARQAAVDQNRAELERAVSGVSANVQDAKSNLLDFALKRFVNRSAFLSGDPDVAAKAKADAVKAATEIVDAQTKAIETGLTINGGNVGELQRLKGQLNLERNLIDPDKFKSLSEQASRAIDEGFKNMIANAEKNVPKLRQIFAQVAGATGLSPLDQQGLQRSINDQIKQVVDSQIAQVGRIGDAARSAIDTTLVRTGARNPFLELLAESDKRTDALRKNLRGLGGDIEKTLVGANRTQDLLDLSQLRFNTRSQALSLLDEAQKFQQFQFTGSTDSSAVAYAKSVLATPNLRPDVRAFWEQELPRQMNREAQERLDQQLNLAQQSFLTGPTGNTAQARSLFDQEVIKLTPLSNIDQFSQREFDQAIGARQEEAQHQIDAEKDAASQREEQLNLAKSIDKRLEDLMNLANRGGLPVNLGNQAITVVEVTSPKLSVGKRSSKSTTKKSTADAMEPN